MSLVGPSRGRQRLKLLTRLRTGAFTCQMAAVPNGIVWLSVWHRRREEEAHFFLFEIYTIGAKQLLSRIGLGLCVSWVFRGS